MPSGYKYSWLIIAILTCLYLCFPCGLSTGDIWYYAASVKYGREIFVPHHLLYNALGLVFCRIPSQMGFEVISSMKVMNALFAFLTLIAVQQILYRYKLTEKQTAIIISLAGLSFSVIRYATENETYIVPLFFALIASFNYLKYLDNRGVKNLLYTGLWASISILFHQTYIFWWLGLLFGFILEKNKKQILLYLLISLIVPVTYLIVILTIQGGFVWHNIIGFLLGDFNTTAKLEISVRALFFSVVNLGRSFIQVHGYMFNMVKGSFFWVLPGVVSLLFGASALLKFPGKGTISIPKRFAFVHIVILILQLIFAALLNGNAEFMVMIPVLVFILFPFFTSGYEKFLFRILVGMAIWNISYGLIPLHYKDGAPEKFLCKAAMSVDKPVVIVSDEQLINSMIYYQTGETIFPNIYKSPAVLQLLRAEPTILDEVIVNSLKRGVAVVTNCINENTISKSSIIEGTVNHDFFRRYDAILIKSWKLITGTSSVHRIEKKL